MFKLVSDMNGAFGNPKGDPSNFYGNGTLLESMFAIVKSQCSNIPVEYEELQDALKNKDLNGVRDALCDIIVFALGAFHKMGIDADRDMKSVIDGVMSRFVKDNDDAMKTALKWEKLGVTGQFEGEYPRVVFRSDKDQTSVKGEYIPKGKFLKSASYVEPVFYVPGAVAPKQETEQVQLETVAKSSAEVLEEMSASREKIVARQKAFSEFVSAKMAELKNSLIGLTDTAQEDLINGEMAIEFVIRKVYK